MARPLGSKNSTISKIPDSLSLIKRIRKKEVQEMMGWSKPTLERKVKSGEFIQPFIDSGTPYWFLPQVIEYLSLQFVASQEEMNRLMNNMRMLNNSLNTGKGVESDLR